MPRSAYFASDDEATSVGISFLAPPPPPAPPALLQQQQQQQVLVHSTPACTTFPLTSYVLWDRTPQAGEQVCLPSRGDSLPPLYLSPESIDALLAAMDGAAPSSMVCSAALVDGMLHFAAEPCSQQQQQQYPCLSIPVEVQAPTTQLPVFSTPSSLLVANLRQQFVTGRNHSLKSSLRMRAAGFVTKSTSAHVLATLRLEAIVPNEVLVFQQVRPPPFLSTPLSIKLVSVPIGLVSSAAAGYLTLNKTRKVVPLLETDPVISLAPLVGVWVSTSVGGELHNDPFIVGACVRFLKDAKIRERVFVDVSSSSSFSSSSSSSSSP